MASMFMPNNLGLSMGFNQMGVNPSAPYTVSAPWFAQQGMTTAPYVAAGYTMNTHSPMGWNPSATMGSPFNMQQLAQMMGGISTGNFGVPNANTGTLPTTGMPTMGTTGAMGNMGLAQLLNPMGATGGSPSMGIPGLGISGNDITGMGLGGLGLGGMGLGDLGLGSVGLGGLMGGQAGLGGLNGLGNMGGLNTNGVWGMGLSPNLSGGAQNLMNFLMPSDMGQRMPTWMNNLQHVFNLEQQMQQAGGAQIPFWQRFVQMFNGVPMDPSAMQGDPFAGLQTQGFTPEQIQALMADPTIAAQLAGQTNGAPQLPNPAATPGPNPETTPASGTQPTPTGQTPASTETAPAGSTSPVSQSTIDFIQQLMGGGMPPQTV